MSIEEKSLLHQKLYGFGVIPVITIDHVEDALPLADALIRGGLPVAEITFRTESAAKAIQVIKQNRPELYMGAGTILTLDQMKKAREAGADFLVAPGLNPLILSIAITQKIPFIPGCSTASDIEQALEMECDFVKFFPAEASNARRVIPDFNGPYGGMSYMPTGGVNLENLKDYLRIKNIICCGGSWIASSALLKEKKFDEIEANAALTVARVKEIREGE